MLYIDEPPQYMVLNCCTTGARTSAAGNDGKVLHTRGIDTGTQAADSKLHRLNVQAIAEYSHEPIDLRLCSIFSLATSNGELGHGILPSQSFSRTLLHALNGHLFISVGSIEISLVVAVNNNGSFPLILASNRSSFVVGCLGWYHR